MELGNLLVSFTTVILIPSINDHQDQY